jgi:2,3,4,5-tetrahydropyridine-2,6-dicarboxylate N-succinyltransferase
MTPSADLVQIIDAAFERREEIGSFTKGAVREAVEEALALLDSGSARVAEKTAGGVWRVNQWLKKAVLLSFRLNDMSVIAGGPGGAAWWDKVPSKFAGWDDKRFRAAGFRAVPGCVVRRSAYIAPGVVLMPCFVNLGAYVDQGTMIDTWARSEVAEGVIVRQGAVLSMGVFIGASTKIADRDSGEVFQGEVPPYAVVVPGTLPAKPGLGGEAAPNLACAVIVKRVDEKTRAKTSINELLRD